MFDGARGNRQIGLTLPCPFDLTVQGGRELGFPHAEHRDRVRCEERLHRPAFVIGRGPRSHSNNTRLENVIASLAAVARRTAGSERRGPVNASISTDVSR